MACTTEYIIGAITLNETNPGLIANPGIACHRSFHNTRHRLCMAELLAKV